MTLRKEEKDCWNNFEKYLGEELGLNPTNWREGEDPPDCYFTIDSQDYAVEITTIMVEINLDSRKLPEKGFRSSVDEFAKEIEDEAVKKGLLDGAYVISFFGPFSKFRKKKKKIKNASLKYMKESQAQERGSWKVIYKEGSRNCAIYKAGTGKKWVSLGIGSPDFYVRWTELAPKEACYLLHRRACRWS